MNKNKVIQFYTKSVYGNSLDYVINAGDAKILAQLTGRKTITSAERELLRDLTGGFISFEQVLEPSKQ